MIRLIPLLVVFTISTGCKKDLPSTEQVVTTPINTDTISLDYSPRDFIEITLEEFPISGTTIRAMEVINETEVWFAGSNGKWGYTKNDGENWTVNELVHLGQKPNFRSISVQSNGDIFLVSIEKPAAIFKSKDQGNHWDLVYEDSNQNAFFDAVDFWNDNDGIVLGDPINNCFHVAITHDGGDHWTKMDCSSLPPSTSGEYPFAASNTNIALSGTHAWFATGGKDESRVFHSPDLGKTWEVVTTPITSGNDMTGIYSIHFYDEKQGIIAGGDWDNVVDNSKNIAFTNDGGNTWSLVANGNNNGYVSCVQFIPETQGKEIFTLSGRATSGASSMGYSNNNGESWQTLNNTNYLSIQFITKNIAWVSGKNKIARLTLK